MNRGKTSGRSDDVDSVIDKRLKVFYDNINPVVDHYGKVGKLYRINSERPIPTITADLEKHLDSIGIFPTKK